MMEPRAVRIVSIGSDVCHLQAKELGEILLDERIVNKKVAILSVAGGFRKGKSFLLNILIHFLRAHKNGSPPSGSSWLDDISPSAGFSWKGGEERDTTGILLWNEPFFLRDSDGEEFVLFLMDTQGTFDHETTMKGCATIFGISTLTSAFQIYNVTSQVGEDDLQHLHLFTQYGKLALDRSNVTPFQTLMFLVRDCYTVKSSGFLEGEVSLRKKLQLNDKHLELREVRKHIHSSFSKLLCFLLPHPGDAVARWDGGSYPVMKEDFRQLLLELIGGIFDHLSPKTHMGRRITCGEQYKLIQEYADVFASDGFPTAETLAETTGRMSHETALQASQKVYKKVLSKVCSASHLVPDETINEVHAVAKAEAVSTFREARKMWEEKFSELYMKKLEAHIENAHQLIQRENARRKKEQLQRRRLIEIEYKRRRQEIEAQRQIESLELKRKEERENSERMEREAEDKLRMERKKAEQQLQDERERAQKRKEETENKLREERERSWKQVQEAEQRLEKQRQEAENRRNLEKKEAERQLQEEKRRAEKQKEEAENKLREERERSWRQLQEEKKRMERQREKNPVTTKEQQRLDERMKALNNDGGLFTTVGKMLDGVFRPPETTPFLGKGGCF